MSPYSRIYSWQLALRQRLAARQYGGGNPVELNEFRPGKILFVLSGLIGDSVMSLPPIEAARRLWPDAKIAVLGKKHNCELIAACNFFDELYEFNADPFSIRRSDETKALKAWLSEQHFDAAFILLGNQFAHLLAAANIPFRVGVKGTPLESCLTHRYDIGTPRTWGVKERLNAIRCLGLAADDLLPTLEVGKEARETAHKKLIELGLSTEKFLVLHPFGSTPRQWWSLENIPAFAAKVKETHNLDVIIVGGPENEGLAARPNAGSVIDAAGKLSLPELLAVIEQAQLVVTTDSGPFHIAGGLGKKTIGLFRARRPEHARQYPSATAVFGRNEECMNACKWDECRDDPCSQMAEISAAAVLEAVKARLANV